MIKMRLRQGLFFDTAKVIRAVDKATRQALSKAGAFIRRTARSSIRKRKSSATPGNPPHSHSGLLRRLIFFSYDPTQNSVVIGPARAKQGTAPNLLEFGGTTTRVQYAKGGKKRRVQATYRKFPFMGPALAAEAPNLPRRWQNSVRG